MSTLYLVATPIGNLEDITTRAVRVLREVILIAAEDTRRSQKLLNHLNIQNRLISFHEHNKLNKLEVILEALKSGDVAVVSDAGTPGLNDPGFLLVRAVLAKGHQVSPIPGPSAPVAALVTSGLPTDKFTYLGYLPRKPAERRRQLEGIIDLPTTLIYLETPHRLLAAMGDMLETLGDRQVAVARELTKLHEEIFRGLLSEAITYFENKPPRGEFTLVVAGVAKTPEKWKPEKLEASVRKKLSSGTPSAELAKQLALESRWARRDVYDLITKIQNQDYD